MTVVPEALHNHHDSRSLKWRGLQRGGYLRRGAVRCLRSLVDLDGFEPSTSSMPFKKHQSLADSLRQNKGLSERPFGRRWTPREAVFAIWTLRGLRDSTSETARRMLSRARLQAVVIVVCLGRQQMISLLRMMPTWSGGRLRDFGSRLVLSQYC